MPLSLHVYKLNGNVPEAIPPVGMDEEARLQDILAARIEILDPDLLVIGREVRTTWQSRVDILAINSIGHLVVVELKRDKTPREVVAQVLEYGGWVRSLDDSAIAELFASFLKNYHPDRVKQSLDEAFKAKFRISLPDELNASHQLLIVAAELDDSTERIVEYLTEAHDVPVNAVFFRVFKDNGQEYLTRAWLREPGQQGEVAPAKEQGEWNGESYVNFGEDDSGTRNWEDARTYGFVSAGGGNFYTGPFRLLAPGSRIWVNVPGTGFAGVGKVRSSAVPVKEFQVGGKPFLSLPHVGHYGVTAGKNPSESTEMVVPVEWMHTEPLDQAVKEKGFYGNQWTVTQSTQPKWHHTVERLKARWGIAG
jgi:hypothetical protein